MNLYTISIFLITYLICSISPSIEICKIKKGEDIRNLGSRNAGTTNAIRVMGKFWGIVVFLLDILKVFISYGIIYFIGKTFNQDINVTLKSIFIVAATLGHCYPIYYSFKGGKGVAVTLAASFILDYKVALVCLIVGILLIIITRMVSIGSVGGIILFVIITFVMNKEYIIPNIIVSIIILLKHRTNIIRIMQGKENKIY